MVVMRLTGAIGIDKQWDIEYDNFIRCLQFFATPGHFGSNRRVHNFVQRGQFIGIVKNNVGYSGTIKLTITANNSATEPLDHCRENRFTRLLQLSHNEVSIDQYCSV